MPETEVSKAIDVFYDGDADEEVTTMTDRVRNYTTSKDQEWKAKYFGEIPKPKPQESYSSTTIKSQSGFAQGEGNEMYHNLQKAIKQEGNMTQEDLKKLARKGSLTPLLAPFPIAKDFIDYRYTKGLSDKYKHAYINCVNAQRGLMSSLWAENLSGLKEYHDVKSGANTPLASYEDMDANLTGEFLGIKYPESDCDELVQRYFKKLW